MSTEPANPLRVAPFRWAIGSLCAFIGVLMLIEPHQFGSPQYRAVQPHLDVFGPGFVIAGVLLLYVAALMPRAAVSIGVHALAGAALLFLASGFGAVGVWNGAAIYAIFGLGTLTAGILPLVTRGAWKRGDLLVVVAATAALAIGLLMLLVPSQYGASVYDSIRPDLSWYGAALAGSGIASIGVEARLVRNPLVKRAVHVISGVMFLACLVKVAWPSPTGVLLYAGLSYAVGVHPWLKSRLQPVDAFSLQTRSALLLVALAALPLITAVAVVADQAEHLASRQALDQQEALAVALAADADDYTRLHRAAVSGLASMPGLLDLSTEARHSVLKNFGAAYPDVLAFSISDIDGNPLGRSDDNQLLASTGFPVYEDARRLNAPSLDIRISTLIKRPIFAFGVPLRGDNGQFVGLVTESLESTRLADQITQASTGKDMLAYLVDGRGRVIAHPDATLVASFADVSATPPVAAFLSAHGAGGVQAYTNSTGQQLAGYATLRDFGWGVIVERPTAVALEPVRRARELAFDVLLALVAAAVFVAVIGTRWLTRPLAVLADAAQRHAVGDYSAPLPESQLTEIARLAAAFRRMRQEVANRTRERDRAGAEARQAAEALERNVGRLEAIVTAQTAIAHARLDRTELMEMVTAQVQSLTGATGAGLEIAMDDDMVFAAASGSAMAFVGTRFPLEASFSGLCVRTGQTLRCDDTELDPRVDGGLCSKVGIRSIIVAPLSFDGRVAGVLSVFSSEPAAFDVGAVDTLRLMAGLVGAALTQAQTFADNEHQALHDALTRLPNRVLLLDRLHHALQAGERTEGPVSLLLLDLDGFKVVNDSFGHHTGDLVLQEVARRLSATLRGADTVGRLGGDEFAIVLPESDTDEARQVATRILARLALPLLVESRSLRVGASIGIATSPGHGKEPDTLMRHADAAMYSAKRAGIHWAVSAEQAA